VPLPPLDRHAAPTRRATAAGLHRQGVSITRSLGVPRPRPIIPYFVSAVNACSIAHVSGQDIRLTRRFVAVLAVVLLLAAVGYRSSRYRYCPDCLRSLSSSYLLIGDSWTVRMLVSIGCGKAGRHVPGLPLRNGGLPLTRPSSVPTALGGSSAAGARSGPCTPTGARCPMTIAVLRCRAVSVPWCVGCSSGLAVKPSGASDACVHRFRNG
jgi:hypothetical protein